MLHPLTEKSVSSSHQHQQCTAATNPSKARNKQLHKYTFLFATKENILLTLDRTMSHTQGVIAIFPVWLPWWAVTMETSHKQQCLSTAL